MNTTIEFLRRIWRADAFSPTAFLARAVLLTLLFWVSELSGLREYTTFLSGTSANLNVSWHTAATLGLIHLLLYVGFILAAPICLLTAGLLAVWEWGLNHSRLPKPEAQKLREEAASRR